MFAMLAFLKRRNVVLILKDIRKFNFAFKNECIIVTFYVTDFPQVQSVSGTNSIKLMWTQEDPSSQISYFVSYKVCIFFYLRTKSVLLK